MKDEKLPDDSVDDEFKKLISGLQFQDTEPESGAPAGGSAFPLEDTDAEDEGGSVAGAPAEEAVEEQAAPGWISLILSPIDAPRALRAALDLVGASATVVQLGHNTAVYLDSSTEGAKEAEDEALLALLGDERPMPTEVDDMARLVSKLAKGGSIAFVAWVKPVSGEDPEGPPTIEGTIGARRYVGGEPEDSMSAGLVLASMPMEAEELLLGRIQPKDVPDQPPPPWSGWLKGRGRHM